MATGFEAFTDLRQEELDLIKRTIAKGATDDELKLFLVWCREKQLNPLLKQAYFRSANQKCPKCKNDDEKKARCKECNGAGWIRVPIFIEAIDGLLNRASGFPDFDGVRGAAVYENDDFVFNALEERPEQHMFHATKRGALIGAWSQISFKSGRKPISFWYPLNEYIGDFLSKERPSIMLLKSAQSILVRRTYPSPHQAGGSYAPEEFGGVITEGGELLMPEDVKKLNPPSSSVPSNADKNQTTETEVASQEFTEGVLTYRLEKGVKEVKVGLSGNSVSWKQADKQVELSEGKKKLLASLFDNEYHLQNHLKSHYQSITLATLTWEEMQALWECKKNNKFDPRWYSDKIEKPVDDQQLSEVRKAYFGDAITSAEEDEFLNKVYGLKDPECIRQVEARYGKKVSDDITTFTSLADILLTGDAVFGTDEFWMTCDASFQTQTAVS